MHTAMNRVRTQRTFILNVCKVGDKIEYKFVGVGGNNFERSERLSSFYDPLEAAYYYSYYCRVLYLVALFCTCEVSFLKFRILLLDMSSLCHLSSLLFN